MMLPLISTLTNYFSCVLLPQRVGMRSDSAIDSVQRAQEAVRKHERMTNFAANEKSKEFSPQQHIYDKLRPEQVDDLLIASWSDAQIDMLGAELERACHSVKGRLKNLDDTLEKLKAQQAMSVLTGVYMENKRALMFYESGFTKTSNTLYAGSGKHKIYKPWPEFKQAYLKAKDIWQNVNGITKVELDAKFEELAARGK